MIQTRADINARHRRNYWRMMERIAAAKPRNEAASQAKARPIAQCDDEAARDTSDRRDRNAAADAAFATLMAGRRFDD